jgi:hypothetical protein
MGSNAGYPYDYEATEVIESGDSGGPDMKAGTHTIVAVNSGAGSGTEVLARVDLLYSWIQQQIANHGGGGGSSSSSSSSSSSTGGGTTSGGGNACAHDICATGSKLTSSCDPCATSICSSDSYCCTTAWDSQCVSEVKSICGDTCGGGGGTTSSSSSGGGTTSGGGGGACGGITYEGTCKGNLLEWCENNKIQKLNCSSYGESCSWNSSASYYDCL